MKDKVSDSVAPIESSQILFPTYSVAKVRFLHLFFKVYLTDSPGLARSHQISQGLTRVHQVSAPSLYGARSFDPAAQTASIEKKNF